MSSSIRPRIWPRCCMLTIKTETHITFNTACWFVFHCVGRVCCLRSLCMLLTAVFRGISDVCPSNHQLADWLKPSAAQHQTSQYRSLLGSVSHKQIKGSTMFLFQLIWKCHIISKRTSVLFMSNILLLLTAQCGPGRALTKRKAKEALLQELHMQLFSSRKHGIFKI